jgi:hypothetical protein
MSGIRAPKGCGLFKPGHDPHWIQISRAAEDGDHPPEPGRLIELGSDGTLQVECEKFMHCLWNHDIERMSEAIAGANGQLFYQRRWGLLLVRGQGGRYAFCVARSGEHLSCPNEAPAGTPAELLEEAGGFTARIEDARRSLGKGH